MAAEDDALSESADTAKEIADTLTLSASAFSRVLRKGIRDAAVEGKGLDTVLRNAALNLSSAALTAGLRPLTNLFGAGLNGIVGSIAGGFTGGLSGAVKAVPFADGGVIGAPTTFGLGGGRVGLMGEAGREAVLPLARGPDGRLGVGVEGGTAGGVNVTVNVSTPDAESFRRSEAQMTAMLARAVSRGRRGL
jgi:phage-related minor tail protein